MLTLRLIPDGTKFAFMKARNAAFAVAMGLIVASIGLVAIKGFNFGIDFAGGTLIEVRHKAGPADLGGLRGELNAMGFGEVQVQGFGAPEDVLIRVTQQEGGELAQQAVVSRIQEELGDAYEYRRIEVVGPRVSADLRRDGVIAVGIALAAILFYLWFRFEWQFAVGAVLTTINDVILTLGLLVLLDIPFDLPIVAAILTIVGYSLNDTVVVYDRIRENLRRYKKLALPELIDLSINQTLARTIVTSLTTFIAVAALWIFGGEALRGFNFTMLAGIVIGTYSSIVISAPLLIFLNLRARTDETDKPSKAAPAAKA
jgi:preprotein translocase SecF subunit